MELTVLGCYGPYPPAGGACSGYLLEEGGCRVLLDCGNGVLSRLQQHLPLWDLDAVVVSHLHSDHVSDLFIMRYGLELALASGRRPGPLPLFAPAEPAAEFARLPYKDVYRVQALSAAGPPLQIGPFSFTFCETVHAVPCLAARVATPGGTLVYSGDTGYFDGLAPFAAGASLFLCEANLQEEEMARQPQPPKHLSAAAAARLAAEAGVERLLLTHLHPAREAGLAVEEARPYFGAVEAAREGARYRV